MTFFKLNKYNGTFSKLTFRITCNYIRLGKATFEKSKDLRKF